MDDPLGADQFYAKLNKSLPSIIKSSRQHKTYTPSRFTNSQLFEEEEELTQLSPMLLC